MCHDLVSDREHILHLYKNLEGVFVCLSVRDSHQNHMRGLPSALARSTPRTTECQHGVAALSFCILYLIMYLFFYADGGEGGGDA